MDRVAAREINLQDFFGRMEATQKKQGSKEQHLFETPGLQKFLEQAISHLKKPENQHEAEAVAHFLMGIVPEPPEGLSQEGLQLSSSKNRNYMTCYARIVIASSVQRKMPPKLSQNLMY